MTDRSGPSHDANKKIRDEMVAWQIEVRGVHDPRVLAVMKRVPREVFVPEEYCDQAYYDGPLPIGHGQTISQPYIVAYMTERLDIRPSDRVLEVGTGSGYQTAVLAELAGMVYTIELVEPLAHAAQERLDKMGYKNIRFKTGNAWKGWPEEAPFDKIMVTAAPEEIPEALVKQLKEGGKIIVPVGVGTQELIEGEKHHEILKKHNTILVRFVPLVKD